MESPLGQVAKRCLGTLVKRLCIEWCHETSTDSVFSLRLQPLMAVATRKALTGTLSGETCRKGLQGLWVLPVVLFTINLLVCLRHLADAPLEFSH